MSFLQSLSEGLPPKPTFTEDHVPDLSGKVYIITGGSSGVGLEVVRILYSKNARVYLAGRSAESFQKAVENIMAQPALGMESSSKGELVFMGLDLMDLRSIKPAVDSFLEREDTLHSVWYNAGVMIPPKGSKTMQGYELQWGTNVVGHFLLHKLLTPILISSARKLATGTVRTLWVSSDANLVAPSPSGIYWADINNVAGKLSQTKLYAQSKAGNIILGHEVARRLGHDGIVSVALSPGHLKSGLQRHMSSLQLCLASLLLFEPRLGALTELFAAFSPQITPANHAGIYVIPWGRLGRPRRDIKDGYEKGNTGAKLWEILEEDIAPFTQ